MHKDLLLESDVRLEERNAPIIVQWFVQQAKISCLNF